MSFHLALMVHTLAVAYRHAIETTQFPLGWDERDAKI